MNVLKKTCPICVLVSSTWLILLALRFAGYDVSESLIALLMGGSVVGLSYMLVKHLPHGRVKLWKLLAIPVGFAAAWALLHFSWGYFSLAVLAYFLLWTAMRTGGTEKTKKESPIDITKELEDCCD